MSRTLPLLLLGVVCLLVQAQPAPVPQWIWFDEGDPLSGAPAATRYFRRSFTLPKQPDKATLEITADNRFAVRVNGVPAGEGDNWATLYRLDVKKHLRPGKNVLAVEAGNDGGPAGLVVRLTCSPGEPVVSDGTWKSSMSGVEGWEKIDFDDAKWGKARVLGPLGKVGPWGGGGGGAKAAGPRTFQVPDGFAVVPAVKDPGDRGPFSLVNMTFDDRGRLLVSQEGGPTLLCTKPDKDGVLQEVTEFCKQVRGAHGMCWADGALYLVGDGPKGTGLYRCRDTKKADVIDEVTLIHRFQGGMGEHGPHAVVHGPDGFLYVVIGNHAFASLGPKKAPNPEKPAANSPLLRWPTGGMGPDQGKPGSTEDVLLPRLNDANGHAANMLAPGGTIWRMRKDGSEMALVAAGFRNHFDAAFSPDGELFSFDSDMEWDEGLPWYRAVRAVHCPPGADFVWRTGAANTPNYYLDSLPPLAETGRGSPTGVTFYDHPAYPAKYRGAFLMADWSLGIIYAAHLKRKGASYDASVEKFCTGSPLNVSDLEVGPDGAVWFTLGGRGTRGGVYRIVSKKGGAAASERPAQPLAAWSRKAGAIQGVAPADEATLLDSLKNDDPFVRRRACEALVRAGIEPPVEAIWPLLSDDDRFVRTAARLVVQRIDPKKWASRIATEPNDRAAREGIVALCKTNRAADHAAAIFARLNGRPPADTPALLDHLRTLQLALFYAPAAPAKEAAAACDALFPHADANVNRELAVLLAHLRRTRRLETPVHAKLLAAVEASKGDRPQQIHYFYCLRLLHDGWTKGQKEGLARWYESTRDWRGGASFTRFLENIYRDHLRGHDLEDRKALLAAGERHPLAAFALAHQLAGDRQAELLPALKALSARAAGLPRGADLGRALDEAFLRTAFEHPRKEYFDDLVRGLSSPNKALVFDTVVALTRLDARPKADDARAFRAALEASARLDAGNRWKAVELLRHWTGGREFGADAGQWKPELAAWSRWFGQAFPKERPLADVEGDRPTPSKYEFGDLLAYLTTGEGKAGDAAAGKLAFDKAQCAKCHRYGKEGEGLGPDLTTVSKRFKRGDTLESLFYPSRVISDQYRSTALLTTKGQRIEGLVAVQGETLTVLQSDGSKVTLRKGDVERQVASLVSVMPEKLLDALSRKEIADLFAYLESEPAR